MGDHLELSHPEALKKNEMALQHFDMLFPEGVTYHGNEYFVKPERRIIGENRQFEPRFGLNATIELIFEYVRRSHFPDRPSRFQSFFAFDSEGDTNRFIREKTKLADPAYVWEVECEHEPFRADMNLLDIGGSVICVSYFAHKYWSGESGSDRPLWEFLLPRSVFVRKCIAEKKMNDRGGIYTRYL